MKKIFLTIFTVVCFFITENVSANTINSINMTINLDANGNAHITEVWDVVGTNGTEWYKVMSNLGNSELTNFTVSMDGQELRYKNWNVNESFLEKKGYYGINRTSDSLELCFGKYDYHPHVFTLNYDLSNYIINTGDSQTLYWTLIDRLTNVTFRNFEAVISSYYEFPDDLDVWGYGYKGYAYVKEGKIHIASDENTPMGSSYVVLLAKFPAGTFNTDNFKAGYETFDDVLKRAQQGTYSYDYDSNNYGPSVLGFGASAMWSGLKSLSGVILLCVSVLLLRFILSNLASLSRPKNFGGYLYKYKDNKKIDKKNVPMFRDIPCNHDILYANALLWLNDKKYKTSNVFGALILKWIKAGNIEIKNIEKGIFNKQTSVLVLSKSPKIEKAYERQLYYVVYAASEDGILEAKEMKRWCRKHHTRFLSAFDTLVSSEVGTLKAQKHIYSEEAIKKNSFQVKSFMDDKMYEDAIELYGLKKFLKEFSNMKEKEPIEVHLWDEYLMFACLFDLADQVTKKLKEFYPEIIQEMQQYNFDYDAFDFINNVSRTSFRAAYQAKSAASMSNFSSSSHYFSASDYSGGGGGFSSGGGGGGSFGGSSGHSSGGGSR